MKKLTRKKVILLAIILSIAFASGTARGGSWSAALYGGYFMPTGGWTEHRYAPGVNQFGGGMNVGLDFEYQLGPKWSLAAVVQYAGLSTSDWENYVKDSGEYLDAQARLFNLALAVRPYIVSTRANKIKLEFGLGIAFLTGEESYQGLTYGYDFMVNGSFSLVAGVEHNWLFNEKGALVFRAGLLYAADGISYADGESLSPLGFPLSLGVRYWF